MEIKGPDNNPHIPLNQPDAAESTGKVSRWSGTPGTPPPTNLQQADTLTPDEAIARLSARQIQQPTSDVLGEVGASDLDALNTWLTTAPENVNTYVEDRLMDALLESYFRKNM